MHGSFRAMYTTGVPSHLASIIALTARTLASKDLESAIRSGVLHNGSRKSAKVSTSNDR
jgi:hypothetical protein